MAELTDTIPREDVCRECGTHLGFGLPAFHLGICTDCQEDVEVTRHLAKSSAIMSVGYNAEHKILEVEYNSGSVYRAYDVEPEDWEPIEESLKDDTKSTGRLLYELQKSYEFEPVD